MMNENYNTPNSGCCGRPFPTAPENKCKYNDCCMNEYAYKQKACIRNKQPDCETQAVIPSITVETVDGITNLANCLVHVTSTNTTYYIDDKHRIMITWAGPVNIPGYDMEGNPNKYKDQIVTDTENGTAVIYDNHGKGYIFGITPENLQQAINNKLEQMAEDGTLQEIITTYINSTALWMFDNVADMKQATNLVNGSFAKTLEYSEYNDKKDAFYKIRNKSASDVIDEVNLISLNDSNLVAQKVSNLPMTMYSLGKSSATHIIVFPNGKTMFIDTGQASEWNDIRTQIASLGINKFDYGIITHFHPDHYGNMVNFINTYDLTNCTWYIGMKPDYANHASDINDPESLYDTQLQTLINYGFTPIVPENDSYVDVGGAKLHFLNTDPTIAENYYGRQAEYYDDGKIGLNDFSLITEIIYDDINILSTGDIEAPVEEQYAEYLGKTSIIIMPHHGVNEDAYIPFYTATKPDYAICNYITDNDTWIGLRNKGFMQVANNGSYMVTYRWSKAPSDIYTFVTDGKDISTNITDGGLGSQSPDSLITEGKLYRSIQQVLNYTKPGQLEATISLNNLLTNMDAGSKLTFIWLQEYNTRYAQLYSDLMTIFPLFYYHMIIDIERINPSHSRIHLHNVDLDIVAYRQGDDQSWNINGTGFTPSLTDTSLIDYVKKLPIGKYTCKYYRDNNISDMSDLSYILTIDVIISGSSPRAALQAFGYTTSTSPITAARYLAGFLNGNEYLLNKVI